LLVPSWIEPERLAPLDICHASAGLCLRLG
jgi:hypothetical protein